MGFTKEVKRSGGSLYITIPSDVVKARDIEEGDFLNVSIEKEEKNVL